MLDQQEWQLHQQAAVPPAAVEDLLASLPATTANTAARIGWPCATQQHLQPLIRGLHAAEAADAAVPTPPPAIRNSSRPRDPAPVPSSGDRTRPPSANGLIGGFRQPLITEPTPGASPRPAIPPPPGLPDTNEGADDQRMRQRWLGDDDSPPDV